jgi:glycoprotein endo-alpha-1,2-mannosidase
MTVNKVCNCIASLLCVTFLLLSTACGEGSNAKTKDSSEGKSGNDVDYNTISFYYNWYGNKETDGENFHWRHKIAPTPPGTEDAGYIPGTIDDIACDFYPELGLYSSNDRATIEKHMQMHVQAKMGVLSVTWWGERDFNNPSIPILLDEAEKTGLKICFHLEPYPNRNARTLQANIKYIIDRWGNHPAFYKPEGKPMFFVYDSYLLDKEEWTKLLTKEGEFSVRDTEYDGMYIGLALKKESLDDILASGFDGFYTYFGATGFTEASDPATWKFMQEWARQNEKTFIPSVGPGYIDTRIRPWNTSTTRDRRDGEYYDEMYKAAIDCGASYISITSFNEWHEGTQIEPAIPYESEAFTYLDYQPLAPDYYLDRTAYWVGQFRNK